jgi:hypothetical protein
MGFEDWFQAPPDELEDARRRGSLQEALAAADEREPGD